MPCGEGHSDKSFPPLQALDSPRIHLEQVCSEPDGTGFS